MSSYLTSTYWDHNCTSHSSVRPDPQKATPPAWDNRVSYQVRRVPILDPPTHDTTQTSRLSPHPRLWPPRHPSSKSFSVPCIQSSISFFKSINFFLHFSWQLFLLIMSTRGSDASRSPSRSRSNKTKPAIQSSSTPYSSHTRTENDYLSSQSNKRDRESSFLPLEELLKPAITIKVSTLSRQGLTQS